jgi:hypothetical protein
VFDMITISRQRSQTQLLHMLFIARFSLKLTTGFGLNSIRLLSGYKFFMEKTVKYMLKYPNQFIVVQRDLIFSP